MKKGLILVLVIIALLSVAAVASAVTIPGNVKDLEIPEIPQLPEMKTKNDGTTQTITFSEPVNWMAAVYCDGHDWTWNDVTWASADHLEATVDMSAHKMSPGYGFWASSNYDADGNCTWSGTGFYEMDYAYDVVLVDGTDVKFDQFGQPRELTIQTAGTEYFGNGRAVNTTVFVRFREDSAGRLVPYVETIKEAYRNGSSIQGRFSMNGQPNSAFAIAPDGTRTVLFARSVPAPAPAPVDENGSIILFEGGVYSDFDGWDEGWENRNAAVELASCSSDLQALQPGQSIVVHYESDSKPILMLKTDPWTVWGQIDPWNYNIGGSNGEAIYSYELLTGAGIPLDSSHSFSTINIVGAGTGVTVTKVEIITQEEQ